MRAMIYAAVTMLLALALVACEDDNPARRDGEGGGGGAGGTAGEGGFGGAGGEGGAEPEVDAAPEPEPGWSDAGLWIGWPADPSDMDTSDAFRCSEGCGGCREIHVWNPDGWRYDTSNAPASFPVNAEIRLIYTMKIGNCIAAGVLPDLLPFEGGPYIYEMYGNGRIQVEPTGEDGRGEILLQTGPTVTGQRIMILWPSHRGGSYTFHFTTFDNSIDDE